MNFGKEMMSADDVSRTIKRLAMEITEVYKKMDSVVVIGIRTRGFYLAKRLVVELKKIGGGDVDIPIGAADITFYRDDLSKKYFHPSVESTDISFSTDGKDVILVDDVLYTGRTIRAAMETIFGFGRPESIKVVVLIDRPKRRELPIFASFVGKSVELYEDDRVDVFFSEIDKKDSVRIIPFNNQKAGHL